MEAKSNKAGLPPKLTPLLNEQLFKGVCDQLTKPNRTSLLRLKCPDTLKSTNKALDLALSFLTAWLSLNPVVKSEQFEKIDRLFKAKVTCLRTLLSREVGDSRTVSHARSLIKETACKTKLLSERQIEKMRDKSRVKFHDELTTSWHSLTGSSSEASATTSQEVYIHLPPKSVIDKFSGA